MSKPGSRFPTPETINPVRLLTGEVITNNVFLKAVINHPRIEVGDYTYASDFDPPNDHTQWAARLAPYLYESSQDRLVIGKFGQIAHGVRFITNSANHKLDGFSTFPFAIHDPVRFETYAHTLPAGRDTVIGHDVWIGMNATILPGTQIGNGVIVGAGAVVAGNVPDYAVVAGNRATTIRMRFGKNIIDELNAIAWWDWDIERILAHEDAIVNADLDALRQVSLR